jgi:dTDP-4-amino-4,6-dideoxygalactose transaminase
MGAVGAIPFNRPQLAGGEHAYVDQALVSGKLSGNGEFGQRCARALEERLGAKRVLMTPSCTAALEMAGLLLDLEPGDEVLVPSFTFVSTANAFALRGAVPVFVDVSPRTLNVDPAALEAAITDRTKAIVVVHYGGIACDMDAIGALAKRYGLVVIEDAAHALPASLDGKPLGSIGQLSTFSFHETKNVQCGEGGALAINDESFVARAEILQEKGTDRARFFRGEVDKYTWRDLGSSFLMSDISAAFLWAQIERLDQITADRMAIWQRYHEALEPLEQDGLLRRPVVPSGCEHSAHLYYVLLPDAELRQPLIELLAARGVHTVFHYVPLHASPAGRRLGRAVGSLETTDQLSARLLRLPLWAGLGPQVDTVLEVFTDSVVEIVAAAGREARGPRRSAVPHG